MELVRFDYSHAEEARQIARENYEDERRHNPVLPEVKELPELSFFAKVGLGAVALEDGRMLGFLCAWPPRDDVFGTTGVKGTFVPIHAHGVRSSLPVKDRERIYSRLYQAAAELWVKEGILSHGISLYTHDAPALTSFFTNGFGMRCIDAIRPLDELPPKEVELPQGMCVEYRELPREEWGKLLTMHNALRAHLGCSPVFMKFPPITEEELYRETGEDTRYFTAVVNGQLIAYIKLGDTAETFVSEHDSMMNICGAYCLPEFRGIGIYHNLLSFLITTLKNESYHYLGVDMESFNPNARGFWRKHFTEYTNSVVRRIDDKAVDQGGLKNEL
jgi:GNAT superfamily N-acetyltransferase